MKERAGGGEHGEGRCVHEERGECSSRRRDDRPMRMGTKEVCKFANETGGKGVGKGSWRSLRGGPALKGGGQHTH